MSFISKVEITEEELKDLYIMLVSACSAVKTSGRSTSEIVGEVFTRVRSESCKFRPEVKLLFKNQLKNSVNAWPPAVAKLFTETINDLLVEKHPDTDLLDMELSLTSMKEKIAAIEKISTESSNLCSRLIEIDKEVRGE